MHHPNIGGGGGNHSNSSSEFYVNLQGSCHNSFTIQEICTCPQFTVYFYPAVQVTSFDRRVLKCSNSWQMQVSYVIKLPCSGTKSNAHPV